LSRQRRGQTGRVTNQKDGFGTGFNNEFGDAVANVAGRAPNDNTHGKKR
jgi:hypothetical protein